LNDAEESFAYIMPAKPNLVADEDEASLVSDLGTECSEDARQKKMSLRHLFGGLSYRSKNKAQRRASM
jgi:hypothetical protein